MFVLQYKFNTDSPLLTNTTDLQNDIISNDIENIREYIRKNIKPSYRKLIYPLNDEQKLINLELNSFAKHINCGLLTTDQILIINDLNSRSEILKLSNIASSFKTVYLIKPRLSDPLSDKIYALLIDKTTTEPKQSKIIHNLSDIIDLSFCVYSYMKYLIDLVRSTTPDNEFKTNYVKLQFIKLSAVDEYNLYSESLNKYVEYIINDAKIVNND